jgi:flagellar motor switch protein FliM
MGTVGDILSQEEIAALLHDATPGASGPIVATFDFAADDHQIRALLPLFDPIAQNFARRLQHTLSAGLRQPVAIAVRPAVCHGSSTAALATLGAVSTACLESTDPVDFLWVAIESSWVIRMVDAYYGGAGGQSGGDYAASLAANWAQRRLIELVRSELLAVWPPAHPLRLAPVEAQGGKPVAGAGENPEKVILQPFALQMAEQEAELALVIPLSLLTGITASEMPHSVVRQKGWQRALGQALREAPLALSAQLAEVQLTVRELLALRSGDILPLEAPSRVKVYLEDRSLMEGEIGMTGGRKVVRLRHGMDHLDDTGKGVN